MMRAIIIGVLLIGCGGPRVAEIRQIEAPKVLQMGPKASPEEVSGEVPPLRGLAKAKILVPERLIPPEAPADPEPVFE